MNIVLPKELVKRVDRVAKNEYRNRSELIREAVRVYLQGREKWEEIFRYGQKKAKQMGITSEEQVNEIVYNFRHKK